MKTLYSFVGNICSGKSTISKIVSEKHNINLFSIDNYRIKHNACLITEEWAAWDNLTSDIQKESIAIFESSGLSDNVNHVYKLFDKVIIIMLDCDDDDIIKRISERKESDYKEVPFWLNKKNEHIENKISGISDRLSEIKPNFIYNSSNLCITKIVEQVEKDLCIQ